MRRDKDIFNAADEKKVEEERKKVENERDQEIEDIKSLVKLPEGRRFMKRLFVSSKLTNISMTGNSWTYFNEGARNVVKPFWNDLAEVAPEVAAKLITEILIEEKENK